MKLCSYVFNRTTSYFLDVCLHMTTKSISTNLEMAKQAGQHSLLFIDNINDHSPMVIKSRTGFQYICLSYKEYCIYAMPPQNQNHISQHVWHDKRPFAVFYSHPAKHKKNILEWDAKQQLNKQIITYSESICIKENLVI